MDSATISEDYGQRLLPQVIDKVAKERPNRIAYSFPITDDPSQGFHDISNSRYANAVNRTAWWIENSFGRPPPKTFPSIGYIGPNDLCYPLILVAAVKVGYKMVFLSPRNSIEGHLAVLDKVDCKSWALPKLRLGRVEQVLARRELKVAAFPELLDLLHEDNVPPYPYSKTFTEARQEPFVVLHTSGSTGLPKPIVVPNGSLATPDMHHNLPKIGGKSSITQFFETPYRIYSTFPNFHSAGMVFCAALPFFYEAHIIMGPVSVPINLDLINAMFDYANVDGSFLAPSSIEEISRDPQSLERIGKTKFTLYGGGPLNEECGDRVSKVCRIFNIMGVTEGSLFPMVQVDREDWKYIHFHPYGGFTYKQRTGELFEQFQTRDSKLDLYQAFMQTFPDQDEVAIKDLYVKHPTKTGLFLYRGRADDVIVLSNGEKVNPLDMEACINNNPAVKACLVVGQGKFQTTVLIELRSALPGTEEGLLTLKQSIWKSMQAANVEAPAHGQLHKDYILFASSDKPFVIAGKGTIIRAATTNMYSKEIDDFYRSQELKQTTGVASIEISNLESIEKGVLELLKRVLPDIAFGVDNDFFLMGVDSLSVFRILAGLRSSLRSAGANERGLKPGVVYANPTVRKLSRAIDALLRPESNANGTTSEVSLMQDLIHKYTHDLPARSLPASTSSGTKFSVILTGSTGSFGSYILEDLLSQSHIERVFCLNRTADARERQIRSNNTRRLKADLLSERVKFLHTNLSKPKFGLSDEDYDELLQNTTHIIHNQWQVDFNLSLSSFEPHLIGVRRLVDFALASSTNPAIFFISSVGVVKSRKSNAKIPEALVTDFSGADGGYGRSKLVAEWILEKASTRSAVKSSVCRLGQIAGPVDLGGGSWNKQEWLPTIIATSEYLDMVPSDLASLNRIDWLPVNYASRIVLELAGLDSAETASEPLSAMNVFHEVNPRAVSWETLLPAVTASLGPSVSVVPWSDWLAALENSADKSDFERNSGLKLLDFYRELSAAAAASLQLPILETTNSQLRSTALRNLEPVKSDWMSQWMAQWSL